MELKYYKDNVRTLLESDSEEKYKEGLVHKLTIWSQPFSQYYIDNVHKVISRVGAWTLQPFGLTSITTNQSESFNCVNKRLNDWKEAPVDVMALSLFRLAQFHNLEVQRGRLGLGEYQLRDNYHPVHYADIVLPVGVVPYGDIVSRLRKIPDVASNPVIIPTVSSVCSSTLERASAIISSGGITLDAKLGVFTVSGTTEPRVVQLFPKQTCSCPATASCYHVLAARMAVGLAHENKRGLINLTQLRRNKRTRADKTSGRKRPRLQDVDVVAADDADPVVAERLHHIATTSLHPIPELINEDIVTPEDSMHQLVIENATSLQHTADLMHQSSEILSQSSGVTMSSQPSVPSASTINNDICHVCNQVNLPAKRGRPRIQNISWVDCDRCARWFHIVCLGFKNESLVQNYVCMTCREIV